MLSAQYTKISWTTTASCKPRRMVVLANSLDPESMNNASILGHLPPDF